MTNYILHVALLLGLGFILYQVLLKKETFYSLNRMILASYLVLSFSLPLIHIPQNWSLKSVDSYATNAKATDQKSENATPTKQEWDKGEKLVKLDVTSNTKDTESTNIISAKKEEVIPPSTIKEKALSFITGINWKNAFKWTYLIGLGIFLINFLVQFSILIFYRLKYPTLKDGKLTIVEMEGDKAPFSFLNMIYINPSKYDYDTYEQILAHEKIHITKWHSLDIFMSEIALIVLWFNPFAWLYRKAVEHNLEYLTDQEMLASGANAEMYQMNLLKVSVPELPLSLSTNYNQSFLKKRIHMMNAKKSSARSTWKYLFILPILGLTVALFNPTILAAQNTQEQENQQEQVTNQVQNYDQEHHNEVENVSENINVIVNQNDLISLDNNKIELIDSKKHVDNSTNAITDLSMFDIDDNVELSVSKTNDGFDVISTDGRTFSIDQTNGKTVIKSAGEDLENEGVWEAELKNNSVCLHIKKGGIGKNYYWSSSECFLASDFKPAIKNNTEGEFSLTRGPGTLKLNGEFSNNKGTGRYTFTPNTNFITTAKNQGYKISEDKLIHFFLSGVEGSFFKFLKSNGYNNVDKDELLALAIHDVNEEYIMDINGEFKKANYEKPSVEELIALKIHDVDMDYIKSFGKALYEDLTVDQIIAAAIHDVDPKFISEFKALGYKDLTFDNLIAAAIHDVDIEYVKELKGAGFKDISFDNLIAASIHDVDPEYITAFKAAGMDVTFDNMIAASIHDIDVDYIKAFQNAGFKNLTFDNLVAAGVHDVDVEYLKKAKSYGFELTFDQLIAASIHDVDLGYIEAFSKSGLKNLSFDNMIAASVHDVDPQFIKDFDALGYSDLTFDNLIAAAVHDVDIAYIKGFKESGFTDLTFDNFIAASIHDVDPAYVKKLKALNIKNISFEDIIAFGIHDIETEDIKGFQALGFDLPANKYIEAGIHDLTPKDIKKMQEKGHKGLDFDEYMKLKIHGF